VTAHDAHDVHAAAVDFGLDEHGGWPGLLTELLAGRDLTAPQARAAMGTILAGRATAAQLIGFVVALRAKGETADELSGLLDAVLTAAELVPLTDDLRDRAVDVVGTGGDRSHSINVSTMAALVVAGAGVPVCKHGARGASSQCGTADVLEALGVQIELTPGGVARCIEAAGIGFCFAPRFHPAFRFAAPSRREIGIPTVFNLLGPMANPGRVRRQLIGVAEPRFAGAMLASLRSHGSTAAWVVHGGGLDELTTTGPSTVLALDPDGAAETFEVDPIALGLAPATHDALVGGDPAHNAGVVRRVLGGEHGAHRDIVTLNAGAALVVAGEVARLAEGVELARSAIDDGRAAAALDALVAESRAAGDAGGAGGGT
jgi:anthranilate phosphoribosyltransferase